MSKLVNSILSSLFFIVILLMLAGACIYHLFAQNHRLKRELQDNRIQVEEQIGIIQKEQEQNQRFKAENTSLEATNAELYQQNLIQGSNLDALEDNVQILEDSLSWLQDDFTTLESQNIQLVSNNLFLQSKLNNIAQENQDFLKENNQLVLTTVVLSDSINYLNQNAHPPDLAIEPNKTRTPWKKAIPYWTLSILLLLFTIWLILKPSKPKNTTANIIKANFQYRKAA